MAKKFKKTAKEIQRLSGLYQSNNQPIGVAPAVVVDAASASGTTGVLAMAHAKKHAIIRHDLISLLIIAAVMIAALFTINYLVDHTGLGATLTQIIGKVI